MKVEVMSYSGEYAIENAINDFIAGNDIEVKDIKYSIAVCDNQDLVYSAMIMYEEK